MQLVRDLQLAGFLACLGGLLVDSVFVDDETGKRSFLRNDAELISLSKFST